MVGPGTSRNDMADAADAAAPSAAPQPSGSRGQYTVPLGMAALLLAAAVLITIDATGYKDGADGEPGPAAIPFLVAGLCAVAAIALAITTLRSTPDEQEAGPVLPMRVLAAVAALLAAGFLLEQIGFFVTFTGLTLVIGLLSGARRWWTSLVVAVVSTWLVMIVFGRLFAVPLPASPIDVFLGG